MRVTFKEVGQGDTLLLEWLDDGHHKIGIIDSNLKESGINPCLDFLKSHPYTTIEFILLSHPHEDHYSGLNEVITYCERSYIKIKTFFHTASSVPEFLISAVRGNVQKRELSLLFRNVQRLYKKGLIEEVFTLSNNSRELKLNTKWALRCLSPSNRETSDYNSRAYRELEVKINNSDANLLSALLMLYSSDHIIYLTSDTVASTFKRIFRAGLPSGKSIILGQLPHHGAIGNYHSVFWRNQIISSKGIPGAISVGINSYGHPSKLVIEDMEKNGYRIFLTNRETSGVAKTDVTQALDMISTIVSPVTTNVSSDIIFDCETCKVS